MAIFFQHPFGLSAEPRMAKLQKKMWLDGPGIFWYIYEKLRLGGGRYPLDSIMLIAGNSKARQRKVSRVLTEFDLFIIENGMVSLQSGLSVADISPKKRVTPSDQVGEIRQRLADGYSDNLFPEESRQMDEAAITRIQDEIRETNIEQLESINYKP